MIVLCIRVFISSVAYSINSREEVTPGCQFLSQFEIWEGTSACNGHKRAGHWHFVDQLKGTSISNPLWTSSLSHVGTCSSPDAALPLYLFVQRYWIRHPRIIIRKIWYTIRSVCSRYNLYLCFLFPSNIFSPVLRYCTSGIVLYIFPIPINLLSLFTTLIVLNPIFSKFQLMILLPVQRLMLLQKSTMWVV